MQMWPKPRSSLLQRREIVHSRRRGEFSPDWRGCSGGNAFPRSIGQSVNRGKYSKPSDVILPDGLSKSRQLYLWGVVYCVRKTLPAPIKDGRGEEYRFTVEHDPQENNYSHSELRAYKDDERREEVSASVKKKYRLALAFKLQLEIKPLV